MIGGQLTGPDTWFEDLPPGLRIRHARSATIDAVAGAFMAKFVMNTAQVHWNDQAGRDPVLGPGFVVFGMITASTVLGLASQDTVENMIRELRYDDFRFLGPVYQGDTISAYSEVLERETIPDRQDAGVVTFLHWGVNQSEEVVFRGRRRALIKCRPSFAPSTAAPAQR